MYFKILKNSKGHRVHILNDESQLANIEVTKEELAYIKKEWKAKQSHVALNRLEYHVFFIFVEKPFDTYVHEELRKKGAKLTHILNSLKIQDIYIDNQSQIENAAYCLAEGMALSNYQFLKYKSKAKEIKHSLASIYFSKESINPKGLEELDVMIKSIYLIRDLVNEPLQYLTAEQLSQDIEKIGKENAFKVNVLQEAKIKQLKMGGLLAVNRGSQHPPTFTIMEHRHSRPLNKRPIVLVGKGVVYDTGGLSLKPTLGSMDQMKSDMSGAALVTGIMAVAGNLDLPVHLIGLVPATDNRPGEDAYVPGDVITMYDGTTIEVLNTDAEGRLILADALHYAKKYDPELVIDFATLTGAAAVAVGDVGMVCMGNADESIKGQMKMAGENQYERLVELPLWTEYETMLKSDIADMKNVAGRVGGAITAGQFLKHFTDYPWMHFDIAGVSFNENSKDYRPMGGTGYGLRMMIEFLKSYNRAKN